MQEGSPLVSPFLEATALAHLPPCLLPADSAVQLPAMRWLYLHHASARWYQFVTSTFCHASWYALSPTMSPAYQCHSGRCFFHVGLSLASQLSLLAVHQGVHRATDSSSLGSIEPARTPPSVPCPGNVQGHCDAHPTVAMLCSGGAFQ